MSRPALVHAVTVTLPLAALTAVSLAAAPQQPAPQQPPPQQAGTAPATDEVVLVGAGDIAKCEILGGAVATARLLDNIPGTVFTTGDNAYDDGTAEQFQKCYGPTWGRHKDRTRPAPGNHDYHTEGARPYYDYFGELAGPYGRGYYSYNVGAWHVVSLNSYVGTERGSSQLEWLKDDLAANKTDCILAYWHIPLFSSGPHGGDSKVREIWKLLYAAGADVVVNGHDHDYERFAPVDPEGKADPVKGIRQFVVGSGGGGVYKFKNPAKHSEVRDNTTYGVLKLTLGPGRYAWQYVPTQAQGFADSGTGVCSPATP
jgi:hypothetical protein